MKYRPKLLFSIFLLLGSFPLGLFLLVYGASLFEIHDTRNVYLLIGSVLMWPTLTLSYILKLATGDTVVIPFWGVVVTHYFTYGLILLLWLKWFGRVRGHRN